MKKSIMFEGTFQLKKKQYFVMQYSYTKSLYICVCLCVSGLCREVVDCVESVFLTIVQRHSGRVIALRQPMVINDDNCCLTYMPTDKRFYIDQMLIDKRNPNKKNQTFILDSSQEIYVSLIPSITNPRTDGKIDWRKIRSKDLERS